MGEPGRKRIPAGIFLLRKSVGSGEVPVLGKGDFPLRFQVGEKTYVTRLTRKGGIITTIE